MMRGINEINTIIDKKNFKNLRKKKRPSDCTLLQRFHFLTCGTGCMSHPGMNRVESAGSLKYLLQAEDNN